MKKEFIDKLSEILIEMYIIKPEDLLPIHRNFETKADITFEDFLLEEGIANKVDLLEALSRYYQLPAIDVVGAMLDHHDIRLIPKDIMLRHLFIPYHREKDNLTVVAANPADPHLPVVIGHYVSHNIVFAVGLAQDIKDTVREFWDESITYQPNNIENQLMERSQQDVHPIGERIVQEGKNKQVPSEWEETIDDYESE